MTGKDQQVWRYLHSSACLLNNTSRSALGTIILALFYYKISSALDKQQWLSQVVE